mmetsp:Transcript_17050/g.45653  ORF Transcript_17050/g.45653 Transcript_17050/m.45653 type:complete len:345 (+) Transcript_17050:65-1099(+)
MIEGHRKETLRERAIEKTAAIAELLEGTLPDVMYAESNHMFVKTFYDAVLASLAIDDLVLRSELTDGLTSALALNFTPAPPTVGEVRRERSAASSRRIGGLFSWASPVALPDALFGRGEEGARPTSPRTLAAVVNLSASESPPPARVPSLAKGVTVVFLRRRMEDVLKSQSALGWFAKGHSGRNNWYYGLSDVHPNERVIEPVGEEPGNPTRSEVMKMLIGYNLDIEARMQKLLTFLRRVPGYGSPRLNSVEVNLSQLSTPDEVTSFLHSLNLEVDEEKLALLFTRDKNERDVKKDKAPRSLVLNDDEVGSAVLSVLADYRKAKKCLPRISSVDPRKELYHCFT